MGVDPVKLVVYDADRNVVTETPYFRDVLVRRSANGGCHVFGLAVADILWNEAWVLRDRSLVPLPRWRGHLSTLLASLWMRWLGYGISAALVGAGGLSLAARTAAGNVWGKWPVLLELVALLWLLCVLMSSRWSFNLVLVASLAASLPLAQNRVESWILVGLFAGGGALHYLFWHSVIAAVESHQRRDRAKGCR
jgi:hypothetical protein